MKPNEHFQTLDALRGVAAIGVVTYHESGGCFPSGWLAVDLFFMLSGFVIAFAYEEKLLADLSFGDFIVRRCIRLYPIVLAGTLLGLISVILKLAHGSAPMPWRELISAFWKSLILLPQTKVSVLGNETFPLNTVIWSLYFELLANFFYGVIAFRFRTPILSAIVIGSLVGIVLFGEVGGNQTQNFLAGFPRVGFGFFAGVVLFRLHKAGRLPPISAAPVRLAMALAAIFSIPLSFSGLTLIPAGAAFALIIIAAAHSENGKVDDPVQRWLGAISYPLYALHRPLFAMSVGLYFLLPIQTPLTHISFFLVLAAVNVFISGLAFRLYDVPFRRALTRMSIRIAAASKAAGRTGVALRQ